MDMNLIDATDAVMLDAVRTVLTTTRDIDLDANVFRLAHRIHQVVEAKLRADVYLRRYHETARDIALQD
jgi:hypothetical protein